MATIGQDLVQPASEVVGADPDQGFVVEEDTEARRALASGVVARRLDLWDGKAAQRIADVMVHAGSAHGHLRPTDLPQVG